MSDCVRPRPPWAWTLTPVLLAAAALSGCGSLATADQPMMVAPTVTPTPTPTPSAPPIELTAVLIIDTTTSANRYADDALNLFAEQMRSWPAPARGGLEVLLNIVSSSSYDAASTLFVGRLEGLPSAPGRRLPLARPEAPSMARCQANAFSRATCEADRTAGYNAALLAVLADEQAAEDEFRVATTAFQDLARLRQSEALVLADAVLAIDLPVDDRGSDIDGALLRASEQLRASEAPAKLLVVWSDLDRYGPQQPGALDLTGIDVLVVHDCAQGVDCSAQRAELTARFTTSGAASVRWLDPSTARLADLFEGVR